ncbi:hypothetical protein ANO14919_142560 [Xylariales sp. No.14919]|nr:hypothetical protein ANO14919_142560 [Xylariales sp. No.14919]
MPSHYILTPAINFRNRESSGAREGKETWKWLAPHQPRTGWLMRKHSELDEEAPQLESAAGALRLACLRNLEARFEGSGVGRARVGPRPSNASGSRSRPSHLIFM